MTLRSRLVRLLRGSPEGPVAAVALPAPERWDDQFGGAGQAAVWLGERIKQGRLYADLPAERVARLAAQFPDDVERTRTAADRLLRHEFSLLGSGPYVPIDPDRPVDPDGYQPIDWRLDPVSGRRFPAGFPHRSWSPEMRPGLADIKLPWELGRCQHWVPLGQAFRLTGDERYAREILRQHADFLEANPIGVGVQYVCTMDVAIRAFNWALAFALIRQSAALDRATLERAYRSLFDHGAFIERNLENTFEVTSNHFLSNVIGMYGVAVVFADLPAGPRWRAQCRAWLEEEMRVQVLDDGADYESSVPYHRLVTELFLSGAVLAEKEGAPLSAFYRDRLRQMCDFLFAVLRPDGLMPQIGDADDGRLHIFSEYGTWQPQDATHLAGPAAALFGGSKWLLDAGRDARWEAAWWGADPTEAPNGTPAEPVAKLFEQAGVAVVRTASAYLVVTNGRVGTNGFGNHKHNDLLSFEVHLAGSPLFVDPGSYVYTSDPDARNLFRSTGYHNTVEVDGVEQNDLKPEYLFRLFETSTVEHLAFLDGAEATEYRGRHSGYSRLNPAVVHERRLKLVKDPGALVITDTVSGAGIHRLKWHFHVAPGVDVATLGSGVFVLTASGRRFFFQAPPTLAAIAGDAWYSPSYGAREPCRAIDFTVEADMSAPSSYEFTLAPEGWRPN